MMLKDGDAANGTYIYQMGLPVGEHTFHFYCEDGCGESDREPEEGELHGPNVSASSLPVLSDGGVDPICGKIETVFTYTVHYYHPDGLVPTVKQVFIDDKAGQNMVLQSGTPDNGTYVFQTRLWWMSHIFYFYFEDAFGGWACDPKSGRHDGPYVRPDPVFTSHKSRPGPRGPEGTLVFPGNDALPYAP